MTQPDILVAVSDIHTGSTHGLIPEAGFKIEGKVHSRPIGEALELWRYWVDLWQTVGSRVEASNARLSVLLNGDLVDGKTFRDQELVALSPGRQAEICIQTLQPMLDLAPHKIYLTRGTPSHVGLYAAAEHGIGKAIGAEKCPQTGSYAAYNWLLEASSRTIWATHHPPSAGRLVRTRKSQTALAANEVASRFWERGLEPPDLAIFAHKHEPEDSGPVLPHRSGTRAIYLGAWQTKTAYAQKVASTALNTEHHAALIEIWPDTYRQITVDHLVYPHKLTPRRTSL